MGKRHAPNKKADLDASAVWIPVKGCGTRRFRVGTLGWSGVRGDLAYLTDGEFLRTLIAAKPRADLVLCAGRRVWPIPDRQEVLRASGGTPVLFEVWAEHQEYDEVGQWHLVQSSCTTVTRSRQILSTHDAEKSSWAALASTIAAGRGTMPIEGTQVHLQLLICGENNILSAVGASVLKGSTLGDAKAQALRSDWILLNPAHTPYRAPSRSAGAAKVCKVGGASPTLQRLTERRCEFRDGTRAPFAVVYVNNFLPDKRWTVDVAGLVFVRGQQQKPARRVGLRPSDVISFEYREFLVSLHNSEETNGARQR